MTYQPSPAHNTSADLEKVALSRFRSLLTCIPAECKIYRENWGNSTVLCLNFAKCPDLVEKIKEQSFLLLLVADYLGLTHSLIFRIDQKVVGWMTLANQESK